MGIFMLQIRTDLAIESHELCRDSAQRDNQIHGVDTRVEKKGDVTLTHVMVSDEAGAKILDKPIGAYATIEAPDLEYDTEVYEQTCRTIADELRKMVHLTKDSVILVVGLGNDQITPDALGPYTIEQLMVTHHMKQHMADYLDEGIRSVCALAPGVLGTTGMETVDIVKGVVNELKPDVVIAVDALASRSLSRLGNTIQIANTGITPGAGVGNRRDGLNEETLGVKVIAVGVPTVVDAATVAIDSIDMVQQSADAQEIKEQLYENMGQLMVTPKNIDLIIERASKTVANGINLALHDNMSFEQIQEYVG